ncbi:hypothetical protein LX99_02359 [Mucilaginibacter oryzae]|uniref:Uncharacterized protein n=1 Tax=Mucilaginibacter oryzae TaxID=468058 RepID=A0A316HJU9_9SPHI|nr:hypothetical protein [Mucilaginibacter oryzae]PWK78515.1 hypothetical protein LX99_02359 [Mucilaginibacter oryzae]
MDTAILVDVLNKNAFNLVNKLNAKGFSFTNAALMKNHDAEDWYLVLGIPHLQEKGSRAAFEIIYNTIKENNLDLSLNDVKLVDDRSTIFELLRKRFSPSEKIFKEVFRENYIDGVRFPDSVVYSVKNVA